MKLAAEHTGYFAVISREVKGPGSVRLLLRGQPRNFLIREDRDNRRWRGGGRELLLLTTVPASSVLMLVVVLVVVVGLSLATASPVEVLSEPVQKEAQELLMGRATQQVKARLLLFVRMATRELRSAANRKTTGLVQ